MDYKKRYEEWCTDSFFDQETKKILSAIKDNDIEIIDRFYNDLSFGTGGLRGVIGVGTNRMNKYTVAKATQGLANFILKEGGADRGVAVAFDSRHMSPEFSELTALCLNANGIRTYRFDTLRPTPELSFAVRELGCIAGVVITASHNPAEYNGYKVYWEDGAQITSPKDKEIIAEVNAITDSSMIRLIDRQEAQTKNLYHVIGAEIDDKYMEELKKLVLSPDSIRNMASELTIVYTPLHGTGLLPVKRILDELGFKKVYVVPEQELPDPDFFSVTSPNPEDPQAFQMALELARRVDADIVLATDPDADRLGMYAKDSTTGEYRHFTGNMSGLLMAEYQLSMRKKLGRLPENGVLVKTIVSSNLADEIVKEYGITLIEVLTGFKYIGEQIKFFEQDKSFEYLFGYEESYGCLIGTHARDKDAIVAVMAFCEAAAYYKEQGLTLWDQMIHIYEKYGYYREDLASVTLKGMEGQEKITSFLASMRANPPVAIGKYKVLAVRDYRKDEILDMVTGGKTLTGLPRSNVLYYELENNSWCCVRPSGTEPKMKLYMGVKDKDMESVRISLGQLKNAMLAFIQ